MVLRFLKTKRATTIKTTVQNIVLKKKTVLSDKNAFSLKNQNNMNRLLSSSSLPKRLVKKFARRRMSYARGDFNSK